MDPLTAFSLACGVIQIVDFSTKVVGRCRELYKNGALTENEEIEEMANHLAGLRTNLYLPSQPNQDELLDLGTKCSQAALELVGELQNLKVTGPQRKREVLKKTIKTIWKKGAIDDIRKRLEDYQKVIDSRILIDLRKRFDISSLQQDTGFRELDTKVQILMENLADKPKGFEELRLLVQDKSDSVKQHITHEVRDNQKTLARENYCNQLLESLWFPEIQRRQENINEAYEKTFQWIFEPDKNDTPDHEWSNFARWLECGEGIYWINGKAGSGKTTLMNYICQEDRTLELLKAWSEAKDILTLSFFFWNPGSPLEKSSEGLLRSLIHQVLKRFHDKIPLLSEVRPLLALREGGLQRYPPIAVWTLRRLRATFQSILRQVQETCRICIFIDGLDEFEGDQEMLISMINDIWTIDVKVCLSSRPYRSYSEAFGSSPRLRLQDLTKPDIEIYVWDHLQPWLRGKPTVDTFAFLDDVVGKAEGIFLWVELVVKDIGKGLQNDDSLEQLKERLRLMPSAIEDLYAHMLSRIDKVYQVQAAQLFGLVLERLAGSLLTLALGMENAFHQIPKVSIDDTVSLSESVRRRIPVISAGILEVHLDNTKTTNTLSLNGDPKLAEIKFYDEQSSVDFLHRTANDFFRESSRGKQFMDTHSKFLANPHTSHVRAQLARVTLLGFPNSATAFENVHDIMDNVSLSEWQTGNPQLSLCDDVDRVLATVYQTYGNSSSNSHWSAEWVLDNNSWGRLRWAGGTKNTIVRPSPRSKSSSRSSSADSFQSASSEVWVHASPNFLPTRPVDFLGLAAMWGLTTCIRQELDSLWKDFDQKTADHLLCCSVWGIHNFSSRSDEILIRCSKFTCLITELLALGGDPNIYIETLSATVWEHYLLSLRIFSFSSSCMSAHQRELEKFGLKIVKAFVENGADLHKKVCEDMKLYLPGLVSMHGCTVLERDGHQVLHLSEETTPLYVLQETISKFQEFGNLEKEILGRGGSSSKQRYIALKVDNYRPYMASERQYDKLTLACQLFSEARGDDNEIEDNKSVDDESQDNKTSDDESEGNKNNYNASYEPYEYIFTTTRLQWDRRIAKLYCEIRKDNGDTGIEDSLDDDQGSFPNGIWDVI